MAKGKRRMPKALQVNAIKKSLKSRGVEPDTVDVRGLVDSSLHMDENLDRILSKVGKTRGRRSMRGMENRRGASQMEVETKRRQVERRQEGRSPKARATDRGIKARVFPPVNRIGDRELDVWMNAPDEWDIKGVDWPPGEKVGKYVDLEEEISKSIAELLWGR
ncbi:MAG: hypothetical protein MAG715_00002 [Methanonatronarchaeales archaeon]|nr:hypothetical protein [Methanonatronarchaeales archaeon]